MKVKGGSTIKQYVTHAEKFGIEGVMEAARDAGLNLSELESLLVEIDKIEFAHARRSSRYATAKKHKLTVEQRVKRLCGISDEPDEETT